MSGNCRRVIWCTADYLVHIYLDKNVLFNLRNVADTVEISLTGVFLTELYTDDIDCGLFTCSYDGTFLCINARHQRHISNFTRHYSFSWFSRDKRSRVIGLDERSECFDWAVWDKL